MAGDEEEDDANAGLKLIQEYNQHHYAKRFYQRIVAKAFLFFTIDPFSIYKRANYRHRDAAKFQMHQTSPLKIQANHQDEWLRKWRRIVRLIAAYLCAKFTAIIFVQVALHAGRGPLISTSQSNWSSRRVGDWEAAEDEQGPLMVWGQVLGNPVIVLPGVTIFLYGMIAAIMAHTIFYLFHHYTIEPFDSVHIRLWLEPAREFRRIDLSILRTLKSFSLPLERSCNCTSGWKRRKFAAMELDHQLIASKQMQSRLIELLKRRYWLLRPVIYSPRWYRAFDQFASCVSLLPPSGISLFFVLGLPHLMNHELNGGNRDELGQDRPLSYYQLLTLLETLISLAFLIPLAVIQPVMFISLCYSQMILLNDVKRQLSTCLRGLRRLNCHLLEPINHLAATHTTLVPFIKISHSLDELRNNVKFITQLVSINVVVSSTACVSILLSDYLDGEQMADFRTVVMMFHWVWANPILFVCAYIYTSASKLETILWSMMAELHTRELRNNWLSFEFQVAEFWRRLIMSRCFSDSHMSVRPFGIKLTYDRALQLNFLAVSFAGLLRTFSMRLNE